MAFLTRAALLSKIAALFPKASMANPTNSAINDLFTDVLASSTQPAQGAETAVATTGVQIDDDADYVIITSANAAHIVVLPPCANVSPGKVIKLESGANGFELSTGAVGDLLNNVASSVGVKSAAIPATGLAVCTAVSAAETGTVAGWLLQYYTELGALATAIVPD
jgi:hypothetical protein